MVSRAIDMMMMVMIRGPLQGSEWNRRGRLADSLFSSENIAPGDDHVCAVCSLRKLVLRSRCTRATLSALNGWGAREVHMVVGARRGRSRDEAVS